MASKSSPDRDDLDDPLYGRVLGGRYRLARRLGRGGMGSVYAAHDLERDDEICAVKLITGVDRLDDELNRRLEREATAVRAIDSAYVVRHRDSGVDGDVRFLVMDRVEGEDLGFRLARDGRIPVAEVLAIAADVLRGLRAAHVAGVFHRDLKPDNVMLLATPGDDGARLKIVDFGVSKLRKPTSVTGGLALTRDGAAVGTPFYMAPEQAQGLEIDERVDLYSLGALLFECLAARPPHVGESYEQVIVAICTKDAVDVSSIEPAVPPEVSKYIARALARDRDRRFASASHMLRALLVIAPEERRPEDDTLAATPPEVDALEADPAKRTPAKESTSATDHAVVRPSDPSPKRGPSVVTLAGVAALLGAFVTAAAIGLLGKTPPAVVAPPPSATLVAPATSVAEIPPPASASASSVESAEPPSATPLRDAGRAPIAPNTAASTKPSASPVPLAPADAGAKDLELLRKLP